MEDRRKLLNDFLDALRVIGTGTSDSQDKRI